MVRGVEEDGLRVDVYLGSGEGGIVHRSEIPWNLCQERQSKCKDGRTMVGPGEEAVGVESCLEILEGLSGLGNCWAVSDGR